LADTEWDGHIRAGSVAKVVEIQSGVISGL
jgi:hypothetical protein